MISGCTCEDCENDRVREAAAGLSDPGTLSTAPEYREGPGIDLEIDPFGEALLRDPFKWFMPEDAGEPVYVPAEEAIRAERDRFVCHACDRGCTTTCARLARKGYREG